MIADGPHPQTLPLLPAFPGLLGLIVSVYLIQRFSTPLGKRSTAVTGELFTAFELAPRPRTGASDRDLYDEVVSAPRDASLGLVDLVLSVPPAEVPNVIANGLVRLDAALKGLDERACPVPELVDCHARFVGPAAAHGRSRRGRAGSGARDPGSSARAGSCVPVDRRRLRRRYRYAFSQSAGLAAAKDALAELGRLGLGTTW